MTTMMFKDKLYYSYDFCGNYSSFSLPNISLTIHVDDENVARLPIEWLNIGIKSFIQLREEDAKGLFLSLKDAKGLPLSLPKNACVEIVQYADDYITAGPRAVKREEKWDLLLSCYDNKNNHVVETKRLYAISKIQTKIIGSEQLWTITCYSQENAY